MGVFRLNPEGIDHDDLELYLIDHGLEEMGDSTGEKASRRSSPAACSPISARCKKRSRNAASRRSRPTHEYICTAPVELPEAKANEALAMIDKLEQDEDVQNVYHSLV